LKRRALHVPPLVILVLPKHGIDRQQHYCTADREDRVQRFLVPPKIICCWHSSGGAFGPSSANDEMNLTADTTKSQG
ncbi:MAG: hypothetical protein ACK5DM_16490, partial [Planctomyces sp.]